MQMRDPQPASTASPKKLQRQRYGGPALEKTSVNWSAKDRYIELFNFEMEVTNSVETKVYELTDKEKVPVIKEWLGREGLQLIKTFTNEEKEKCKTPKGLFGTRS